jgi:hypothetical protein
MISNKESRLHGAGGDLEGLHNKSADEQGQKNGYDSSFYIFSESAFLFNSVFFLLVLGQKRLPSPYQYTFIPGSQEGRTRGALAKTAISIINISPV